MAQEGHHPVSISYGSTFNPITAPLAMLNLGEGINIKKEPRLSYEVLTITIYVKILGFKSAATIFDVLK